VGNTTGAENPCCAGAEGFETRDVRAGPNHGASSAARRPPTHPAVRMRAARTPSLGAQKGRRSPVLEVRCGGEPEPEPAPVKARRLRTLQTSTSRCRGAPDAWVSWRDFVCAAALVMCCGGTVEGAGGSAHRGSRVLLRQVRLCLPPPRHTTNTPAPHRHHTTPAPHRHHINPAVRLDQDALFCHLRILCGQRSVGCLLQHVRCASRHAATLSHAISHSGGSFR